jgi:hypothetical protein
MLLGKDDIKQLDLQSGDIFACEGKGPLSWLTRRCIEPPTDRFHYGIVWLAADDGRDRVILESVGEGQKMETVADLGIYISTRAGTVGQAVSVGRLSRLHGRNVRFFRPRFVAEDVRACVPVELTAYGRGGSYGYWLLTKLAARSLAFWVRLVVRERRFRRLHIFELPYIERGRSLICTMAVDVGYALVNEDILPLGVAALPNAYEQAVRDGVLIELHKGES